MDSKTEKGNYYYLSVSKYITKEDIKNTMKDISLISYLNHSN